MFLIYAQILQFLKQTGHLLVIIKRVVNSRYDHALFSQPSSRELSESYRYCIQWKKTAEELSENFSPAKKTAGESTWVSGDTIWAKKNNHWLSKTGGSLSKWIVDEIRIIMQTLHSLSLSPKGKNAYNFNREAYVNNHLPWNHQNSYKGTYKTVLTFCMVLRKPNFIITYDAISRKHLTATCETQNVCPV